MKYTIFWDKTSLRPSPLMEKWWPNVCPWILMDGHCFSCWVPVHGPCAPTQGFSKVLLRSNPNHPNGWRFTNENHPFTVRFPSLGLVQIPWRKNMEKNTKVVQNSFTTDQIHKKTSAEHSVGKSSGDRPSLNINWHESSAKKNMAPWHSSQAKNSPFHQLTSRDHLEIPPGDTKWPGDWTKAIPKSPFGSPKLTKTHQS